MSADIQEAKRRLPLHRLMAELGYGDHAKKSARCIFHSPDTHPSFGIFEHEGQHFFKCQACGVKGDAINFLALVKFGGDVKQALPEYLRMAGVGGQASLSGSAPAPAKSEATPNSKVERKAEESANKGQPHPPSISTATVQPPKIAYKTRILDRFREDIRRCGVVGEDAIAATLYLLITTRLLDKPVSAAVKGLSSSGKSFTTVKTVEFFPPNAVIVMTAMSERALVYSEEEYAHRTLILYEATALREGAEDNLTAYFVRSLLSEGRIEYPVTVRDPKDGSFKTKTIIKEGPTNLIITTTKTRVHAENETRLLSLNTNDTREQTKAIFRALASEQSADIDKSEWCQLQVWLQNAEHRVTIPYAERLAELIPPVAVRLRRDFGAVLSLVRAHAILHQLSREKDAEGRIVATIDDYAQVRELVAPIVSEAVGATVSPVVRETVEIIAAIGGESGVMAQAIAEQVKLDKGTVSRRLRMAADQGFIRNLEDRRGKPGRWVTGDPLPGEIDLLPQPSGLHLSDAGCTVASDFRGYGEAHKLLADFAEVVIAEATRGLHPKGHTDCQWATDLDCPLVCAADCPQPLYYPREWTAVLDYLAPDYGLERSEERAFGRLCRIVRKIECEVVRGTPLTLADGREWSEGNFPPEFEAARTFVREELAKQEAA